MSVQPKRGAVKQPAKQVTLSCDHVAVFEAPHPKAGEWVYCRRCQRYRTAVRADFQYELRCNGCRMATKYGQDEAAARTAANAHGARYPGHVVEIRLGLRLIETVDVRKGQAELPMDDGRNVT